MTDIPAAPPIAALPLLLETVASLAGPPPQQPTQLTAYMREALVTGELLAAYIDAAAKLDPPLPPLEAAEHFAQECRAIGRQRIQSMAQRATRRRAPLNSRLAIATLLSHIPAPPPASSRLRALAPFVVAYAKGAIALGTFPSPISAAPFRFAMLRPWGITPQATALDLALLQHLCSPENPTPDLAQLFPEALHGTPPAPALTLCRSMRYLTVLRALAHIEAAAKLHATAQPPTPHEIQHIALEVPRSFGRSGPWPSSLPRQPILVQVLEAWLDQRLTGTTLLSMYGPADTCSSAA